MARRFGGPYSPGPAAADEALARTSREAAAEERRVDAAGAKSNLLFLPAAVAAFAGLFAGPGALILSLGAAAVLSLSAWLLREGLRSEAAFAGRAMARPPAVPRKLLASICTGAGTFLAGLSGGTDVGGSLLYALAATGLHVAAFGIDPLRDKRVEGMDTFQQARVARVVQEAEGYLASIRDQVRSLGDRKLEMRVASFEAIARRMIRIIEQDPRDLTEARRYLSVYLMGAHDATLRFSEVYGRTRDAQARSNYEALLHDLEVHYAQGNSRLLEGGREAMDIEIKVLRDRLRREGVAADR